MASEPTLEVSKSRKAEPKAANLEVYYICAPTVFPLLFPNELLLLPNVLEYLKLIVPNVAQNFISKMYMLPYQKAAVSGIQQRSQGIEPIQVSSC